jgi:hypothetical protein
MDCVYPVTVEVCWKLHGFVVWMITFSQQTAPLSSSFWSPAFSRESLDARNKATGWDCNSHFRVIVVCMILSSISPLGEFHDSASCFCSFDLLVSCPCCCDLVCASGHYGKMWKHLIPCRPQNIESWLFYISYTILVWCSLLSKMNVWT